MMTMPVVNLIPQNRLIARAKRHRVRRWTAIVIGYTAVLVLAYGGCYLVWGVPVEPLADQLTQADTEISNLEKSLGSTKGKIAQVSDNLDSAKAVQTQPDWSTLLAIVSKNLGDDIVLQSCELKRFDPIPPAPPPGTKVDPSKIKTLPPTWTLYGGGLGKSPSAVSQFVLRLEGTNLFEKVTLVKTVREPFRDGEATSFTLECALKGKGKVLK